MCLRRLADGEQLLDESGRASILLQEFTSIRAAQKQKQADIKGMHARVQSLIESSESIRTTAAAGAAAGAPGYATARSAVHGKDVNGIPAAGAPPCAPLSDRSDPTDGASATASGRSTVAPGADDASHCSSRSCTKAAGDAAQPQAPLGPRLPPPAVPINPPVRSAAHACFNFMHTSTPRCMTPWPRAAPVSGSFAVHDAAAKRSIARTDLRS